MLATMISPAETAKVLGGRKVFRRDIRSAGELMTEVSRGFPVSSLNAVLMASTVVPADETKLREMIVPTGTYKRRLVEKRLSSTESERLERVARVFATARHVLASEETARQFLYTAHPELDGKRPIDLVVTELGARQIESILWGVFFGIPA